MRKLKVQMNFEGIPWDDDMVTFCIQNLKNVDSILLGRITADGFIPYWKDVAENPDPNDINSRLGKPIDDIPKVIYSNTLRANKWENATIINGDLKAAVANLKEQDGKDIIVYGGNSFVASLAGESLIDEYYFFVDPLAVSANDPILKFANRNLGLQLEACKSFRCGTVLLHYTA